MKEHRFVVSSISECHSLADVEAEMLTYGIYSGCFACAFANTVGKEWMPALSIAVLEYVLHYVRLLFAVEEGDDLHDVFGECLLGVKHSWGAEIKEFENLMEVVVVVGYKGFGIGSVCHSYWVLLLVCYHAFYISLVNRCVADGCSVVEKDACSVDRHYAVVLKCAEIVDEWEWATSGYKHFDAAATYIANGIYSGLWNLVSVERHECAVYVEEYCFNHYFKKLNTPNWSRNTMPMASGEM